MSTELNLDELYQVYTSEEQIKESFTKRTVATGRYTFNASRAQARIAPDNSPFPGRKMGSFFGQLKDDQGKRKGSIGFDASWEPLKNKLNRLDNPSMLWGQLVTALGMKAANVAEIITAAGKYPLNVYVTETFKDSSGKWIKVVTTEDRAEAYRKGFELRNFVQSVSKVN